MIKIFIAPLFRLIFFKKKLLKGLLYHIGGGLVIFDDLNINSNCVIAIYSFTKQ